MFKGHRNCKKGLRHVDPKQAVGFWLLSPQEMLFLKVSCSVSETVPEGHRERKKISSSLADTNNRFLSSSVLNLKISFKESLKGSKVSCSLHRSVVLQEYQVLGTYREMPS